MDQLPSKIRIGTRGSPLAMTQTRTVKAALEALPDCPAIEIVQIHTSGEWSPAQGEQRLNEAAGGKGQFAKEIEEALLSGRIDCAVHSMKDMDSHLPEGLSIVHMLPREDARDALLFADRGLGAKTLEDLPQKATVGTASVRRQAMLKARRPDLNIVPFRGNVQTRIDKLRAGQVDVSLLACAGLKRLGLFAEADLVLSPEEMLPAAGQGAVGIELRTADKALAMLFDQISCTQTLLCVAAERAALALLDGSCHTPIGAYAVLENDQIYLRVCVAYQDGRALFSEEARCAVADIKTAETLGRDVASILKDKAPADILD